MSEGSKINLPEHTRLLAAGGGRAIGKARPLLEQGLELSDKAKPNVLVIPTAKATVDKYDKSVENMRKMYAEELGLPFNVLHGYIDSEEKLPSDNELREKMEAADVYYVTGGNTRRMMGLWQKLHIDTLLHQAMEGGKVVTGISAGAVAWFKGVHSDSESYEVPAGADWDYVYVDGLGYIDAVACPHYNSDKDGHPRKSSFHDMLSNRESAGETEVGLALDNSAGLLVVDGLFKVIASVENARAYVVKVDQDRGLMESEIERSNELAPLKELADILS